MGDDGRLTGAHDEVPAQEVHQAAAEMAPRLRWKLVGLMLDLYPSAGLGELVKLRNLLRPLRGAGLLRTTRRVNRELPDAPGQRRARLQPAQRT